MRWASFFWIQSLEKNEGARALFDNLDPSITKTRAERGDAHRAVVWLAAVCDRLLRRSVEVCASRLSDGRLIRTPPASVALECES